MSCFLCAYPPLLICPECETRVCIEHIDKTICPKCKLIYPDDIIIPFLSDLEEVYISTFVTLEPKMNIDMTDLSLTKQVGATVNDICKKMKKLVEIDNRDYISLKTRAYYHAILESTLQEGEVDFDKFKNIIREINSKMIVPISKIIDVDFDYEKKKKKIIYTIQPSDEVIPFVLKGKDQEIHARMVLDALKTNHVCLDTSHPGSGKTYVSMNAIRNLNIKHVILFTPKIMETKWENVLINHTNKKFILVHFTYSEISSPSFTANRNILLTIQNENRVNIELQKGILKYITPETIVVIDEVHNLKERSKIPFKFMSEITRHVAKVNGYILGLSATPVEKEKEKKDIVVKLSMNYTKEFNLLDNAFIFHESENIEMITSDETTFSRNIPFFFEDTKDRLKAHFSSMKESTKKELNQITTITSILPDSYLDLLKTSKSGRIKINVNEKVLSYIYKQPDHIFKVMLYKYIEDVVDNLYSREKIIKIYYLCLLKWPLSSVLRFFIRDKKSIKKMIEKSYEDIFNVRSFNILIHLKKREECNFEEAYTLNIKLSSEDQTTIENAFQDVEITEKTTIDLGILHKITKGLIVSEVTYVPYIAKIIKQIQNGKKIVIGIHYRNTMQLFRTHFPSALYVDGTVKDKQSVIDNFQNTNNNMILVNLRSLNSGVDLDDKIGNKQRYVFIVPDFKFSEQVQFMYRFKRLDSKSEPKIYLIHNHIRIISNLLNKSEINKKLAVTVPDLSSFTMKEAEDIS